MIRQKGIKNLTNFLKDLSLKKQEISDILGYSTFLESKINQIVTLRAEGLDSTSLLKWSRNSSIPISHKLRMLRFLNMIDEIEYNELTIIFKIRNEIAHRDDNR